MIAQPGAGTNDEEEIMDKRVENLKFDDQPVMPDEPEESLWSSILIDEPCVDGDMDETEAINFDVEFSQLEEQPDSSEQWEKVKVLYEKDEIVSLRVVDFNKGGVLVENSEVSGFVPASHLIEIPANGCKEERELFLADYIGREISLKVIEFEPEKERVVFSERAALAGAGQRKKLLNSLAEGDIVRGTITNITSFGAFVDLGGVEGLIHISELSWGRVQHPSELIEVGDQVKTILIGISEAQGRIALSLKRLSKNPWLTLSNNLAPGDIVDAKVSCIEKYGVFARLENGIEGLIHVSSIPFPEDCQQIDEFLHHGQSIKVNIISIEPEKRRLSLKMESCYPNGKTD